MVLSNYPRCSRDFDVASEEYRTCVRGTKWGKFSQDTYAPWCQLREVDLHVDPDHWRLQFVRHGLADNVPERFLKLSDTRDLSRQSGGIFVTAKLDQFLCAEFQCLIDIETRDTSCRSFGDTIDGGHHDGGLVVFLHNP